MAASGAAAQAAPSAPQPFIEEQRQQERERALREQQERAVDVRLPTTPERSAGRLPESEIPCFRIDRLLLEGERADDFQWLLSEAAGEQNDDSPLGRCLGTQGINTVLERLQQALIARGWVTSRVLAAPQDLASGTLRLTLVPGRIAATYPAMTAAIQAGITTLASQATISTFNNAGNLGKVFDELTSSESLKNLATAMVTAGALQGLSTSGLLPENLANATSGTAPWADQLQRQLIDNAAAAVVRSGINGTSLEEELKQGVLTAFLNTAAAQGANWIGQNGPQGSQSLNAFAAEAAHAIVGCAVGAGRSGSGAGCAPGALGAVIGHLTAQAVNPTGDPALANETLQASQLMAGIAGAFVSTDGQGVYTAAGAGVNAAENNWLSQKRPSLLGLSEQEKYDAAAAACNNGDAAACGTMREWAQVSARRDADLRNACATGASSSVCVTQMQIAQAAGNRVFVDGNGNITINGVMFATAGPVTSPFTTSTAGQMAQSTAEGILVEVANQAVAAAIAGVYSLGRGLVATEVGSPPIGFYTGTRPISQDFPELIGLNPAYVQNAGARVNINCVSCTNAAYLRLTGRDPLAVADATSYANFNALLPSANFGFFEAASPAWVTSQMLAAGNGAVRPLVIQTGPTSGHAIIAATRNGEVYFVDAQMGSVVTLPPNAVVSLARPN